MDLFNHRLRLHADPSRVVVRPFHIGWLANGSGISRSQRLINEVLEMDAQQTRDQLELVLKDFEARHWQTRRVFMTRYDEIASAHGLDGSQIDDEKRQLIGAYFCHEYSYAAAALMNPSAVPHPDQSGMSPGSQRILMSLRSVGEGHISSVAFREGIIGEDNELKLAPEPPFATAADAVGSDEEEVPVGPVTVYRHRDSTLSGTVIFPITDAQSKGLEDLRLVHFTHDDGEVEWLGTYTAYNGATIQSELLRTRDFRAFGHVAVHAGERDRDVTVGRDLGSGQPVVGADDVDHALDRGGGGDRASHRCTELGVGGGDRARLQHDDRLFRTELREVPGNQAIHLGGLRALDTEIHRTEPVLEQRVGHRAHHQQQSPDRQDRTSAPGHQNAPPI